MSNGDAGGSGNTGQTTVGKKRKKLTPEEAGFREGKGIEAFRCGDCFFFEAEKCRIVQVDPKPNDVCDQFEPDRRGKMTSTQSPGNAAVRRFDKFNDYPLAYVERRKFSKEKRMELAKTGKALPWGGFPIENCGDVANAIRAIGRAKDRARTIAHIKKHHSRLNCKKKIPASWKSEAGGPEILIKHLLITKVSRDRQTGKMRWIAKASGVERDLYDERMSIPLFEDFIKRAEAREAVPEPFSSKAWNGGLPYLGIAHYLDLGGKGIAGPTEQIWVDGDLFKAKGLFQNTSLGKAAYKAIAADIKNNVPLEQRVRISIAFIDWAHEHEGHGTFKRKSLSDRCKMCADGLGEKVYQAGHLVHLALTRIPAYPSATIELEEKSMDNQKRFDDAESIVGKEEAEELEALQKELVGRSADIDPNAIIVKQDKKKAAGEEEDEEEDEEEEENGKRPFKGAAPPFGGAKSLSEAEEFLVRSAEDKPVLMDSLNVLSGVLSNIAGAEHNDAIDVVLADWQTRIDAEVVKTLGDVRDHLKEAAMAEETQEEVLEEPQAEAAEAEAAPDAADAPVEPEAEPEAHPLDAPLLKLRAAYDEALETPVEEAARLRMLQEPINELALAIKASISESPSESAPEGGVTPEALTQAVAAAVAPLMAELEALKVKGVASGSEEAAPVRRAIQSGSLFQAEKPKEVITEADMKNPKTDKDVTPGLRGLVRRSVGLGR